jgi:hypothetical protein
MRQSNLHRQRERERERGSGGGGERAREAFTQRKGHMGAFSDSVSGGFKSVCSKSEKNSRAESERGVLLNFLIKLL